MRRSSSETGRKAGRLRPLAAICLAAVWLGWGPGAPPATAQVVPEITYEYYAVTPESDGRLRQRSFLRSSPGGLGGDRAVGLALSNFTYEYTFRRPFFFGLCRLLDIDVTSTCRVTLPELKGGDGELRAAFAAFQDAVKTHELEHCRITAEYATKFQKAMRQLDGQECDYLSTVVRAAYERSVRECELEQQRYDQRYGEVDWNAFQAAYDGRFAAVAPVPATGLPGDAVPRPPMPVDPGSMMETRPPAAAGLKNLDQSETLGDLGFYQDRDGVWRNR